MKKFMLFVLVSVLLVGCSPVSAPVQTAQVLPSATVEAPTEVPATATATEVPATATATEVPATATATEVPATATPEVTATPDYYDFDNFVTPEENKVKEAVYKGVNVKYAYREMSQYLKIIDPNLFYKNIGIPTLNFYFLTDNKDLYNKIIDKNIYIRASIVTTSHPEGFIQEGAISPYINRGFFHGCMATEESDPLGGFMLRFGNFKEKTEFKKIEIKDRETDTFVTIYEE